MEKMELLEGFHFSDYFPVNPIEQKNKGDSKKNQTRIAGKKTESANGHFEVSQNNRNDQRDKKRK